MRTTNKQFADLVQKHVIECLSEDETTVLSEQLQNVIDEFNNWYVPYEQKVTPNRNVAFMEFLNGLPSCLSLDCYDSEVYNRLKGWFEECGEEYKDMDTQKEHDLYHHLVVREFDKLYKKHCKK